MVDTKFVNGTRANATQVNDNFSMREYIGDTMEQEILAATQTTGSVSFSATCYGLVIRNKGANEVYINFDAAATTSHRMLDVGEEWVVYIDTGVDAVHGICNTGLTASVRIVGFR